MNAVAASVAPLVHPLSEVIDNPADGGVREGVIPCGGTGSKIVARPTGAPGVISAAARGVRIGVYTGPIATQATLECSTLAVSTAPVGTVGR